MKDGEAHKLEEYFVVDPKDYIVGKDYGVIKCDCYDNAHKGYVLTFQYKTSDHREPIFSTVAGATMSGRERMTYCRAPIVTDMTLKADKINNEFKRWLERGSKFE